MEKKTNIFSTADLDRTIDGMLLNTPRAGHFCYTLVSILVLLLCIGAAVVLI